MFISAEYWPGHYFNIAPRYCFRVASAEYEQIIDSDFVKLGIVIEFQYLFFQGVQQIWYNFCAISFNKNVLQRYRLFLLPFNFFLVKQLFPNPNPNIIELFRLEFLVQITPYLMNKVK